MVCREFGATLRPIFIGMKLRFGFFALIGVNRETFLATLKVGRLLLFDEMLWLWLFVNFSFNVLRRGPIRFLTEDGRASVGRCPCQLER